MATEKFSTYIAGLPIAPSTTPGSDLLPVLQGGVTERAITPLALFGGIPLFGAANVGTVPASGGGTSNFLRADGQWASGPPSTTPITVGSSSVNGGTNGRLLFDNNGTVGEINPSPGINIAARFGSMDVWQRGAGGSSAISVGASTTAYTVDGGYLLTNANQICTVFAVPGIAPGSFKAAQVFRNNGQTGTGQIVFGFPLDSDEIALFAGQFVTLSFTASTGANWSPTNGTISAQLIVGTGVPKKQVTGFTGQTIPITISQNIAAGTTAARYQGTSAAIVPANTTQAEIQFSWTPVGTAGAADAVTIDDVQLEVVAGSTSLATPFAAKDFATQLRLAQRHFWKTFLYGTAPVQNAGGGTNQLYSIAGKAGAAVEWFTGIRCPVQMRSNSTVITFNPQAANAQVRDESAGVDCSATTVVVGTPDGVILSSTGNAATAVGNLLSIHLTVDAGI